MQNEERQITFNDIPEVLSEILKRFDLLDQSMELIREEVRRTKRPSLSDHIPMDVKEACEFLKIKKSTMYTYIQNGEIPVNQKGKKYTFFRDDLIKWLESGCKIEAPISTMEINHSAKDQDEEFERIDKCLKFRSLHWIFPNVGFSFEKSLNNHTDVIFYTECR